MVKRRHSPYPSYARPRPPSQAIRYTPALLAPMPLTVQQPFAILRYTNSIGVCLVVCEMRDTLHEERILGDFSRNRRG